MIKPLTLAVTIIYALTCSGCVTAVVWSDACTTTISRPQVRQIDPPANGQPARAIINYSVDNGDGRFGRFDRTLPLGPDGLPPATFVYQGKLLTLAEIAQDIPKPQKQAILSAKLTPIDQPSTSPATASFPATSAAKIMRNWSPTFHVGCDEIGLVILSPDTSRVWPHAPHCGGDPDLASVNVKPGEVVVFIPLSQPRPAGDLAKARLGATLLTPPAVAADAALVAVAVPLIFLLIVTGGPRC